MFAQLFLAQIFISNNLWDDAITAIVNTFYINPHLSHNENYVTFVCKLFIQLVSFTENAKKSLLKLIETICKELVNNNDKDISILFYLADICITLGREGYIIANKIYELLLVTVRFN